LSRLYDLFAYCRRCGEYVKDVHTDAKGTPRHDLCGSQVRSHSQRRNPSAPEADAHPKEAIE
jgi:hypothetical protein